MTYHSAQSCMPNKLIHKFSGRQRALLFWGDGENNAAKIKLKPVSVFKEKVETLDNSVAYC